MVRMMNYWQQTASTLIYTIVNSQKKHQWTFQWDILNKRYAYNRAKENSVGGKCTIISTSAIFCVQENHFDMTFLRRIWEKNYLQVVKKGDNKLVIALLPKSLFT